MTTVAVVFAFAFGWAFSRSEPRPTSRWTIDLPEMQQLEILGGFVPLVLSPDGSRLIYAARTNRGTELYRRSLDQLEAVPMQGTEGASRPFFSPDGQWLWFFADGKLQKAPAEGGGAPVTICDLPAGVVFQSVAGGVWTPDDAIIVQTRDGLAQISSEDCTPKTLTRLDRSAGELAHQAPQFLPNVDRVLFTVSTAEEHRAAVLDLVSGDWRLLDGLGEAVDALFLTTGHLIYGRSGGLEAVPFDLQRLEPTGPPTNVVPEVYTSPRSGRPYFTVSRSGSLVYVPGSAGTTLVWVDRQGQATPIREDRGTYHAPRLSPSRDRVAVDILTGNGRDIWVYDLERGSTTLLTDDGASRLAVWTPDGRRIALAFGDRMFWKPADGTGESESLLDVDLTKRPGSWSSDGRTLAFVMLGATTGPDIWMLTQEGDRSEFLATPFSQRAPRFSPDDRWVAYVSDESGRDEVYVLPYPGPGRRLTISTDGGREPVWAPRGRELFYRQGDLMMVVAVEDRDEPFGRPRQLFGGQYDRDLTGHAAYDVSLDGQRFLMIQRTRGSTPTQLNVVLNWFEELKERVPN